LLEFLKRKFAKEEVVTTTKEDTAFHRDYTGGFANSPFAQGVFGGETTFGGIRNKTDLNGIGSIDYYSLRTISRKLFTENKYAGMALGRLTTNVINDGINLQAEPSKIITKFNNEQTVEWSENVEEYFDLWASDKSADWSRVHDFSALQKVVYMESLVEGDVLIQLQTDSVTKLPAVKITPGRCVANGFNSASLKAEGNTVVYGVETNKKGEHIAYHVIKKDGIGGLTNQAVRILAKGKKSKRQTAFLVYESPPPAGKVRGFPILTRILQATDQVETYAIYEVEAAKVNAAMAMWVEKTKDRGGSNPLDGVTVKNSDDVSANDNIPTTRVVAGQIIHEVAFGEVPQSFDTKRPNVNYKDFKNSILEDIAAALEIPPEILQLKFGNNYSASRQAEIEFKSYVRKARKYFAKQFAQPVYSQWLAGMVLQGTVKAKGYISAILNDSMFVRNGWQKARWSGFVKQNVDILKEAKAHELYLDMGIETREQAARELTGAAYRSTVERLKPENEMLAGAREPLLGTINTSKSIVSEKPVQTVEEEPDDEEEDEQQNPDEDEEDN